MGFLRDLFKKEEAKRQEVPNIWKADSKEVLAALKSLKDGNPDGMPYIIDRESYETDFSLRKLRRTLEKDKTYSIDDRSVIIAVKVAISLYPIVAAVVDFKRQQITIYAYKG